MATVVEDSIQVHLSRIQQSWLQEQKTVVMATGVEDSTHTYCSGGQYKYLQQWRTVLKATVVEDSTQSYCSGGQCSKLLQWRTVLKATAVEDSTNTYMSRGQYIWLHVYHGVVHYDMPGYTKVECRDPHTVVQQSIVCLATQEQSIGFPIQQYSRDWYAWLHRSRVLVFLYSSTVEYGMLCYV